MIDINFKMESTTKKLGDFNPTIPPQRESYLIFLYIVFFLNLIFKGDNLL